MTENKSTRTARLRAILDRKQVPNESGEAVQDRIRKIVEQDNHVCTHCGFPSFTGSLHPYAGISGEVKAQTRWCNGTITIEPKDDPKKFHWVCPKCVQHWMLTQAELEICDATEMCHECGGKT